MLQAIETRYAGCRFRSRLEARWAVFFDHLGIAWEYEPEGFQLPSGFYLPDFLLRDLNTWFEVKPPIVQIERGAVDAQGCDNRWHDLSRLSNRSLIVARGMPRPDEDLVWSGPDFNGWMVLYDGDGWDNAHAFCTCPWCGKLGIEFEGRGSRVCGWRAHHNDPDVALKAIREQGHYRVDDRCHTFDDARIVAAYTAARSARFEHGENG